MIRRTLFTCGRVNPIAPSIAGRRREYQRSKRARLFRREYFKQSSSNFQIYLCKECPSRPAVSRSRNSKAHRRRISAVFSALLFIRFSKVRYPHRTFRNDANFECASGFVKTSATWKSVPIPANSMSPLRHSGRARSGRILRCASFSRGPHYLATLGMWGAPRSWLVVSW